MRQTSAREHEGIATAVIALVALVVIATVAWAGGRAHDVRTVDSTVAPGPDPYDQATNLAEQLLARALVPNGATRFDGQPPKIIDGPSTYRSTPNLVDVHQIWLVPTPDATVLAYVRTHTPRGLTNEGCCGTSGGRGYHIDSVTFDESFPRTGPIASAQMLVAVTARSATTTWLRVDAQVVWRANRDPATLVPATDKVVTLGEVPEPPDANVPPPRVIADPTKVSELVHLFNALPVAIPGEHGCTLETDSGYVVTFRRTRAAPPDVIATTGCNAVSVTAHGHQVVLDDDGFKDAVFARIGR